MDEGKDDDNGIDPISLEDFSKTNFGKDFFHRFS